VKPIHVQGVGLWTPTHPSATSWCEGDEVAEATQPEAALLRGPLRRRASPLTRMALDALGQATAGCEAPLSELPSVWGSAWGENETAVDLLGMMNTGEGKLSPTRFHNSVFNTAAGYASIAMENRAPSTTLCGGSEIAGTCLLEAACRLEAGEREILLVLLDEPEPPPFGPGGSLAPLALALLLSADVTGALAVLDGLRREVARPTPPPPRFEGLYIAGALPLVECLIRREDRRVGLEIAADEGAPSWSVDVTPVAHT
jgi:hypothetical protein